MPIHQTKAPARKINTGGPTDVFTIPHNGMLEARDRARKRIFILSHRIGISARPMALLPTLAAVKANNIEASLYYGRTTGPLSGTAGADLIREFAKQGLAVRPVHQPRIHAKVLGWDDELSQFRV